MKLRSNRPSAPPRPMTKTNLTFFLIGFTRGAAAMYAAMEEARIIFGDADVSPPKELALIRKSLTRSGK